MKNFIKPPKNRLKVDGKFFLLDKERVWLSCVTYGPFPSPLPDHSKELTKIQKAGFLAIRVYEPPSEALLKAALTHGMLIFASVPWCWHQVFLGDGGQHIIDNAHSQFTAELSKWGHHPAVVGIYIANEIPNDVVRWMGFTETREALDSLILDLRKQFPHLLYAYANFPTTEFLEPTEADFTAFNVYLESPSSYTAYLNHLQHVAGDRPLMLSEIGFDSKRNGIDEQKKVCQWLIDLAHYSGAAGASIFAWSDRWRNGDNEVLDWDFGLNDRVGLAKPVLSSLSLPISRPPLAKVPFFSVIVCVHNGAERVKPFLEFSQQIDYPCYEVLIVDDGSTDHLEELCKIYKKVRYIKQSHSGLSAARNTGAEHAKGDIFAYTDDDCVPDKDWLYWLAIAYNEHSFDLCGGPNLAPYPLDADEAIIASAPGAPSHVMLCNTEAEHIPGCNLTVTRKAFYTIGGFDKRYWVAGDDVDFCWRAEALGLVIGFHGAAFVWHQRRATFYRYFKQQRGYGKAEALLMQNHPNKFNKNLSSKWKGTIYQGGATSVFHGDFVYTGVHGDEPYQPIFSKVMPSRPLHRAFRNKKNKFKLKLAQLIHPYLRAYSRVFYSEYRTNILLYLIQIKLIKKTQIKKTYSHYSELRVTHTSANYREDFLIEKKAAGWLPSDSPQWDLTHTTDGELIICNESLGNGLWQYRIRYSKLLPE